MGFLTGGFINKMITYHFTELRKLLVLHLYQKYYKNVKHNIWKVVAKCYF